MIRKNRKSICYVMTLALCVTLGSSYVRAEDTEAQGINVAYHTQDEIRAFCAENASGLNDALTFAENPVVSGDYSAGKLSDKTLNSAINIFNQVRYIAGISYDVQLDDTYNSLTQTAALVNYVNGVLSHYPSKPADMDEDLYNLGAKGASSSNIAWASWENNSINWSIINGWLEDGDPSNVDRLGHRRWVLNPKMKYTGFGAVTGTKGTYSAMYSFDMKNTKASEYGVAWPAQNMPVEYFGTVFPWSLSMGESVDIESVKVKLTRQNDGKVWNFSNEAADGYFNVNNGGYGQKGCIIFRPKTDRKYAAGDVFDVEITGLGDGKDVSYTVNFFELEDGQDVTAKPTAKPTETPTAAPTETPTVKPTVKPTETPTAVPTKELEITEKPEETEEPEITDEPEETEEPEDEPEESEEPEAPTARPTVTPTAKPVTKPAKVKIKKWKINKNKVTVYFGKVKNASGYQVRYSTSVKYNKNLSSKAVSCKSTKTMVRLKKSRKKHFIQMRAYTKKNGRKVYGSWGNTIKIYKNIK